MRFQVCMVILAGVISGCSRSTTPGPPRAASVPKQVEVEVPLKSNGYDDYVAASQWISDHPALSDRKDGRSLKEFAGTEKVVQLVKVGNAKQCRLPKADPTAFSFPDLTRLKVVARVLAAYADAQARAGQGASAAQTYSILLKYSEQIEQRDMIAVLVAHAARSMATHGVAANRKVLSPYDAELNKSLEHLLMLNPKQTLEQSMSAGMGRLWEEFRKLQGQGVYSELESDHPYAKLTKEEQWQKAEQEFAAIRAEIKRAVAVFDQPEAQWAYTPTKREVERLIDPLEVIPKFIEATLTDRLRLRLTLLGLAIERYRRDHGSYPTALNEVETPHKFDPNTGREFRYEKTAESYRFWSEGERGVLPRDDKLKLLKE